MSERGGARGGSERKRGGPPPLTWLIVGLVLVICAWALLQSNGAVKPASGGPAAIADTSGSPVVVDPAPLPPPADTPAGVQTSDGRVSR